MQAICVVPCALGVLFSNQKYLDVDGAIKYRHECNDKILLTFKNADIERQKVGAK